MLEAPEGGALDRDRGGIVGIDLHRPAEAEGLIRFLGDVEAIDEAFPEELGVCLRDPHARMEGADRIVLARSAEIGEVLMKILLAGDEGAPWRETARAVVEGAEDFHPGAVGTRLEQVMSGGGTAQGDGVVAVIRRL